MKSCACFTSFIDVLTPAKASLLSFSPENRQYLHSAVTNALSEIAIKYDGKLVHRFEERFACYFPLTSDPKNGKAFQDAIECSIEQRMRMGTLSLDCMHHIKIRRVFTEYAQIMKYSILKLIWRKHLTDRFSLDILTDSCSPRNLSFHQVHWL